MLSPWTNEWELISHIPSGAQGDTSLVKAKDGSLSKAVLKVLKPEKLLDKRSRTRMYQEVANLRTLKSEGASVPKVFDSNTESFEGNVPLYFVMEYIAGETLDIFISRVGQLPFLRAVQIPIKLCRTLSIAARFSIVHRDIKPQNIKIDESANDSVVLLDFGLSFNKTENASITEVSETLGNKFCALPELRGVHEDKRDHRSDLTMVCAILFYCLTGREPRNLQDSNGLGPHGWGSEALKTIAGEHFNNLKTLLAKGFRQKIDERFQSVAELTERLRGLLSDNAPNQQEDLFSIAARESNILEEHDPKTRLSSCSERSANLIREFTGELNGYNAKLGGFRVAWTDVSKFAFVASKANTAFRHLGIGVTAKQYPETCYSFLLRFSLENVECVVYCEQVASPLDASNRVIAARIVESNIGPSREIYRYPMEDRPEVNQLIPKVKDEIGRGIETLAGQLQQARATSQELQVKLQPLMDQMRAFPKAVERDRAIE